MMRWIKPIIGLAAVALAGWQVRLLLGALSGERAAPTVETARAQRGSFALGITREGTIESADVVVLRAPRSGSILTWVIDDGSRVKQGDLIAKVDVSEYKFQVDQQRLEYQNRTARVEQDRRSRSQDFESAQMRVDTTLRGRDVLGRSQLTETEQAQAQIGYDRWNLTWAQTDLDKQDRLWQAGIVPATTVDQSGRVVSSREYALNRSTKEEGYLGTEHSSKLAQSAVDIDAANFQVGLAERRIREAVEAAQEQARMASERLTEMEVELAGGEVRSPQTGVIVLGTTYQDMGGERPLRQGDRVWSRMRIATITSFTELQVAVRLEDSSVGRLKVGQETIIRVLGASEQEFRGRVSSVSSAARRIPPWEDPNAPTDQRVFDVKVTVLDPDPKLMRPGVKTKVQFVFERVPKAVYVPLKAVFDRPGGQVVYVVDGNRIAARRVQTGQRNDEAVVVTRGLTGEERLALVDPTRAEAE
jgi:RND family efflux transporter MFP subunit